MAYYPAIYLGSPTCDTKARGIGSNRAEWMGVAGQVVPEDASNFRIAVRNSRSSQKHTLASRLITLTETLTYAT